MSKSTFLLAIAFILAGCAGNPTYQKPSTAGIFDAPPPQSTQQSISGGKGKVLVVLISENTKENVDFLKRRQKDKEGGAIRALGVGSTLDAHIEALDPNYALTWVAKKLKTKFASVKLVGSPEDLKNITFDNLVVVDAIYVTTNWGVDEATASINTLFYDSKVQHIADAKSYRKEKVRGGMSQSGVELFRANHAVRVAALQDWDIAVDRLITSDGPTVLVPTTSTDACVQSALSVQSPTLRQQAITACGRN